MSSISGPLQVVPDIDDKYVNDNKGEEDEGSAILLSDIPSVDVGDTSTQITDLAHGITPDNDRQPKEKVPVRRRRHISSNPPIHRMTDDAQPLTPTEMTAHRQLLSQHRT